MDEKQGLICQLLPQQFTTSESLFGQKYSLEHPYQILNSCSFITMELHLHQK
jgi:hypothetical protein